MRHAGHSQHLLCFQIALPSDPVLYLPLKNLGSADAPGLKDEEGKAPLVSTKTTVEPAHHAALEPHKPLARQQYELDSQSGSLVMPTDYFKKLNWGYYFLSYLFSGRKVLSHIA